MIFPRMYWFEGLMADGLSAILSGTLRGKTLQKPTGQATLQVSNAEMPGCFGPAAWQLGQVLQ